MRWRKSKLEEMAGRIAQLGLERCPVCGSDAGGTMHVQKRPVFVSIGDAYKENVASREADANVLFFVLVTCDLCGYAMQFDSERLVAGGTPMLVPASVSEDDEAEWERREAEGS